MQITSSRDTVRAIGELCVGGDLACADGDLDALASIALQLSAFSPEPIHCELAALADLCRGREISRATDKWASIKDRVYRSS